MAFRKDESRARKDNSAENFNVIRQITLNILKSENLLKEVLPTGSSMLINDSLLEVDFIRLYLLISQLVHSMRFYVLAGWELFAIPVSHARLCTHCFGMDSYYFIERSCLLMFKPFVSVGVDVGADFSFMSIALPNQTLVGKPFKITHSNLNSLETAVSAIKKAEELHSLESRIFLESTGIYHYPLFCHLRDRDFDVNIINPMAVQ